MFHVEQYLFLNEPWTLINQRGKGNSDVSFIFYIYTLTKI